MAHAGPSEIPAHLGIQFFDLDIDRLPSILDLHAPPLRSAEEAFRQLTHVGQTARDAGALSIAVERHYVDRDYIEDYSVFYAKSLHSYENSCRRIHFFTLPATELAATLREIAQGARSAPQEYRKRCQAFSEAHYLGFSVIKPLHGSPVGRTVLRAPQGVTCARRNQAHLLGIELTVRGVPFQQQDVGVSACATTALWSSLRVLSALEPIAPATPAQITNLAVKYYMPLGRAMPQSEGLNIGQMCQAVEALGVSPLLLRPRAPEDTLGLLHSILRSRIAPVLLIKEHSDSGVSHAVAALGFSTNNERFPPRIAGGPIADPAMSVSALLLHDDRIGPYVNATLDKAPTGRQLLVHIHGGKPDPQTWSIDHILVPIHSKVRLSFAALRAVGVKLAGAASEVVAKNSEMLPGEGSDPPIAFETFIWRTHKYVEDLLRKTSAPVNDVLHLSAGVLPRYVGVVRLTATFLEPIDVLVDTTSTSWNLHAVAVVPHAPVSRLTHAVAKALSQLLSSKSESVQLIASQA